jgi:hypothetical protein
MEDGVWRTIGGRRVFIKEGQNLSDAMKESGKFSNKNEKSLKTEEIEKEVENERNKKIKQLEDMLNEKEATGETSERVKITASFEKDGKKKGFRKAGTGNYVLSNNEQESTIDIRKEKLPKFEKFVEEQEKNGWKTNKEVKEITSENKKFKLEGYKRDEIKEEITALKNGFDSAKDYKLHKEKVKAEYINKRKEKMENSYIYSQKRKTDATYNDWYEYGDRESTLYNTKMFEEVIKRKAGQIMNIEEVHHSAKSGSKFSTSIYLKNKDTGIEVRISDHYLPDTPEREYKRSLTGGETRWDKELVLTQSEMEDIVNIKTKKEFDKYLKDLFS